MQHPKANREPEHPEARAPERHREREAALPEHHRVEAQVAALRAGDMAAAASGRRARADQSLAAMTWPAAWIMPALVSASDIGIASDPDAARIASITLSGSSPSSS